MNRVGLTVFPLAVTALLSAQTANRPSTARGDWPTYGGDLASSKYSPPDQVNKDNFSKLRVAWRAKSHDATLSLTIPGGGEWTADSRSIFAELNRLDPKRWRDGEPPPAGGRPASTPRRVCFARTVLQEFLLDSAATCDNRIPA